MMPVFLERASIQSCHLLGVQLRATSHRWSLGSTAGLKVTQMSQEWRVTSVLDPSFQRPQPFLGLSVSSDFMVLILSIYW